MTSADPNALPAPRRPRAGTMERIVKADLARMDRLNEGTRPTLKAMALNTARLIDTCSGLPEYTAAQVSALVKAQQQLAGLMAKLAEVPEGVDDFDGRMGTPE